MRSSFNPPSASSAEGTGPQGGGGEGPRVSTHPPPHRRRERPLPRPWSGARWFQPTLRLIGGGNARQGQGVGLAGRFNPPSASSAEGTPLAGKTLAIEVFQPTLRLIGGGNQGVELAGGGVSDVSTHPPPHRRRELLSSSSMSLRASRFNPPSASSAEGTRPRL